MGLNPGKTAEERKAWMDLENHVYEGNWRGGR